MLYFWSDYLMNKKIFLITLLCLTLACVLPSVATPVNPQQPPADIGALETIIVQTADAAQTQTAFANPTITLTPTPTSTRIPTITPSPTVTFIFLLPTLTPIPTITPIGYIGSGGAGNNATQDVSKFKTPVPWSCIVQATEPPRGAVLQKEQVFYAYWTILNTGTEVWTRITIDLVYRGGYRHDGTKIIDITQNAGSGGTIRVGARFIAPKNAGEYQSFFTLQVGKRQFCGMKISFEIKD